MRKVEWTGDDGRRHVSSVRNGDPDAIAPMGISLDPPDVINGLDWDAIKVALHNELLDRGLVCWDDVQARQGGLTAAVKGALLRPLRDLYRERGDR